MVCHDVVGTVRQEQIVQYIQHIKVHTTDGGRSWEGGLPLKKIVGAFAPIASMLLYHYAIQLHT